MLCTQCGRDNTAGLDYCDYCGEPLSAAAAVKRKTEMDGGGGGGGKRKTAMDAPTPAAAINDPFEAAMSGQVDDPFAPNAGTAKKPAAAPPATAAPAKKRVTQFDQGDPFAPPSAQVAPEDNRRIVGFLITFDGHVNGKHWLIREGRNLLGRDDDRCEIVIEGDDKVSSQHAVLVWRNGRLRLADDKSQNGTFLNDEDVLQPEEVADGAVIRVGKTRLICRLLDPAQVEQLWKPVEGT